MGFRPIIESEDYGLVVSKPNNTTIFQKIYQEFRGFFSRKIDHSTEIILQEITALRKELKELNKIVQDKKEGESYDYENLFPRQEDIVDYIFKEDKNKLVCVCVISKYPVTKERLEEVVRSFFTDKEIFIEDEITRTQGEGCHVSYVKFKAFKNQDNDIFKQESPFLFFSNKQPYVIYPSATGKEDKRPDYGILIHCDKPFKSQYDTYDLIAEILGDFGFIVLGLPADVSINKKMFRLNVKYEGSKEDEKQNMKKAKEVIEAECRGFRAEFVGR
jgi:hypothetical protein